MAQVEPFYFKTATVWHRATAVNKIQQVSIALCGFVGSYARTNRNYEDTETRPYAGKVCKRCDIDQPQRAFKRTVDANAQVAKAESVLPHSNIRIRKGTTSPTPVETYGINPEAEQSPLGSGLSYDDAVRRKPRRILP